MTIFLDYIIKSEIKKEYIKKNVYKILERNLKNGGNVFTLYDLLFVKRELIIYFFPDNRVSLFIGISEG